MALKRQIPEEYMDYDYGFTGVSEEEYRKKETEADQKVSEAEADAARKLRDASLKVNKIEAAKIAINPTMLYQAATPDIASPTNNVRIPKNITCL